MIDLIPITAAETNELGRANVFLLAQCRKQAASLTLRIRRVNVQNNNINDHETPTYWSF